MSFSDELIVLKAGGVAPIGALELLWDLESRGLQVTSENAGAVLAVGPRALITDTDREQIREHRDELLALVTYCEVI